MLLHDSASTSGRESTSAAAAASTQLISSGMQGQQQTARHLVLASAALWESAVGPLASMGSRGDLLVQTAKHTKCDLSHTVQSSVTQ
jgi:hypothetical protein